MDPTTPTPAPADPGMGLAQSAPHISAEPQVAEIALGSQTPAAEQLAAAEENALPSANSQEAPPSVTPEFLSKLTEVDVVGIGLGEGTAIFDSATGEQILAIRRASVHVEAGTPPLAAMDVTVNLEGELKAARIILPIKRLMLNSAVKTSAMRFKFQAEDKIWAMYGKLMDGFPNVPQVLYDAYHTSRAESIAAAIAKQVEEANAKVGSGPTGIVKPDGEEIKVDEKGEVAAS